MKKGLHLKDEILKNYVSKAYFIGSKGLSKFTEIFYMDVSLNIKIEDKLSIIKIFDGLFNNNSSTT